jgi:hypothetical protein
MIRMAWFLRVVELDDGGWACRRGLDEFDRHASLKEALRHLTRLAKRLGGECEIFVHPRHGPVRHAWRVYH